MQAKGDFVWLYEELALTPEAGLDELRLRYRQRVRTLHPDLNPGVELDPERSATLRALNAAFQEAVEFHRRTGRLPGASHRPHTEDRPTPRRQRAVEMPVTRPAANGWFPWAVSVLVLVAIVSLATGVAFDPASTAGSVATPPRAVVTEDPETGDRRVFLQPGLGREAVREIQGEPFYESTTRFEYGPSYVEFHGDKVSGWYSSPMHPLRVRQGEEKLADGLAHED